MFNMALLNMATSPGWTQAMYQSSTVLQQHATDVFNPEARLSLITRMASILLSLAKLLTTSCMLVILHQNCPADALKKVRTGLQRYLGEF